MTGKHTVVISKDTTGDIPETHNAFMNMRRSATDSMFVSNYKVHAQIVFVKFVQLDYSLWELKSVRLLLNKAY